MNPATDPPPDKEQRYAPFRNLMRKRYARLVTVLGTSGLCKVFVSMAEHMQWIYLLCRPMKLTAGPE